MDQQTRRLLSHSRNLIEKSRDVQLTANKVGNRLRILVVESAHAVKQSNEVLMNSKKHTLIPDSSQ